MVDGQGEVDKQFKDLNFSSIKKIFSNVKYNQETSLKYVDSIQ
jgi:hypothetical protein